MENVLLLQFGEQDGCQSRNFRGLFDHFIGQQRPAAQKRQRFSQLRFVELLRLGSICAGKLAAFGEAGYGSGALAADCGKRSIRLLLARCYCWQIDSPSTFVWGRLPLVGHTLRSL
ncbi:MAG: hypothetical protein OXC81_03510 [Betaproteobacteria bacterium]|nr:hypothetical protein [Betaproteobacteria bacterium]